MEKPLKFWHTMTEAERAKVDAEIARKNKIAEAHPVTPSVNYPSTTYTGD